MRNVTIRDVAREAGVSTATVSRVLNHSLAVTDDAAARVHAAIERLGYVPNSIARSLKKESSHTIGFVVSDIGNNFFTTLGRAIEDVLNKNDYALLVCSTDDDRAREEQYLTLLREKQADGIIINTSGHCNALISAMSAATPIVLYGRRIPDAEFHGDYVDSDNFSGMAQLVDCLLQAGHRRIGLINGQPHLSSADERLEGFLSAMHRAGIPLSRQDGCIYSGNFSQARSGYEGAQALYRRGVSAIIAANNLLGMGAMQFCRAGGIAVPQELSLAVFGMVGNDELLYIKPTCVDIFPIAMGTRIAELILERIESKNRIHGREIRFPTALVPGQSTAGR